MSAEENATGFIAHCPNSDEMGGWCTDGRVIEGNGTLSLLKSGIVGESQGCLGMQADLETGFVESTAVSFAGCPALDPLKKFGWEIPPNGELGDLKVPASTLEGYFAAFGGACLNVDKTNMVIEAVLCESVGRSAWEARDVDISKWKVRNFRGNADLFRSHALLSFTEIGSTHHFNHWCCCWRRPLVASFHRRLRPLQAPTSKSA